MNQDTLVLLSGMAPKEPEQLAIDEWGSQFEKDYPKPWEPEECEEHFIACVETVLASFGVIEFSPAGFSMEIHRMEAERHAGDFMDIQWLKNKPLLYWRKWRSECVEEWTRNKWPLIWAKKRMQAAEVA